MASIDTRTRANGTTAYRLRWRYGGKRDGAPQTLTYDHSDDAKKMNGAIEARGHLVYATDPAVVDFSLVTGMRQHTYTSPTFGVIVDEYIASRTRASVVTRDKYRDHVRPGARLFVLVSRPIESITDGDVNAILNGISDVGGCATVAYEFLGSVFKFAANRGKLPGGNPMLLVEAPRSRGRVGIFLVPAEVSIMLDACRADTSNVVGAALADLAESTVGTGFRLSESLGLIVDDVHVEDLDAAWIDLECQLHRPRGADKELRRVPLKTEAGRRRVALDRPTAELFARLIKGKRPDEPVFTDPTTGRGWWSQNKVTSAWTRAKARARKAGLYKSPRIHDLRHTHAAWLITDGIPLLAVSRRLGHTSIKITADTYGHLLPEADDAIRSVLAGRHAALTGKPASKPSTDKPATGRPGNRRPVKAPATRKPAVRTTGRKAPAPGPKARTRKPAAALAA